MATSTYLLLALRGLEFLVEREIRATLEVDFLEVCSVQNDAAWPHMDVMQGEAGVGRILLRTTSPPTAVMHLRSVQAVLALLVKSDGVITDSIDGAVQIGVRECVVACQVG